MKIATWNVNSLRVRLGHVETWLREQRPDVLALQETKLSDADFPAAAFEALGYRSVFAGQRAYNGVALITRGGADDVVTEIDGLDDPQRRLVAATIGGVRVVNLYVPNGQRVGTEKYAYKLAWLQALKRQLERDLARHERLLVLGDFNIAPADRDVHDPAAWEGKVLCSEAERAALAAILALGLDDTFRLFEQAEAAYSWWDYRAGAFRRNHGLRIDLILTSPSLSQICAGCFIDRSPRGWERPSDHVPVVAEFEPA